MYERLYNKVLSSCSSQAETADLLREHLEKLTADATEGLKAILEAAEPAALERALKDYEGFKHAAEVAPVLAEVAQKLESLRQVLP